MGSVVVEGEPDDPAEKETVEPRDRTQSADGEDRVTQTQSIQLGQVDTQRHVSMSE